MNARLVVGDVKKHFTSVHIPVDWKSRKFESRLRQELSMTEVRPLSKAPNPQLLPGCPLLQVCVHLDRLNAENPFHCWLYSV